MIPLFMKTLMKVGKYRTILMGALNWTTPTKARFTVLWGLHGVFIKAAV